MGTQDDDLEGLPAKIVARVKAAKAAVIEWNRAHPPGTFYTLDGKRGRSAGATALAFGVAWGVVFVDGKRHIIDLLPRT